MLRLGSMRKAVVAPTVVALLVGTFATLFTGRTFAAESPTRDQPEERDYRAAPWNDLRAAAYAGTTVGSSFGGIVGASVEYRGGPLVAGALFEAGGEVFERNYTGLAGMFGVATRPTRSVRMEALGVAGVHTYTNLGGPYRLAYAGVRGVATYIPGHALNHFEIGVYLDVTDDLSRETGVAGSFFGPGATVGALRVGLGLQMGVTHDFF
jgi:hypothetical protein